MPVFLSQKKPIGKFYLFLIACFLIFFLFLPALQSFDEDVRDEQLYDGLVSLDNKLKIIPSLADVPAIPMYSQQNRMAMQSRVWGVAVPHLGMYYLDTQKIWLKR
jgi:hypothetical protein